MPFPPIRRLVRRSERTADPSTAPPGDRLPFEQIDVLIVGELGLDHAETGLDPDVIGRRYLETRPEPDRPAITRLAALRLSAASRGDACGIGFADLTTSDLVSRIDPALTRARALESGLLERVRIPIALPTDREVFQVALDTCWRVDPSKARLVLIPNTRDLQTLWISPSLEDDARLLPDLDLEGDSVAIPFNDDGTCDLSRLFPARFEK